MQTGSQPRQHLEFMVRQAHNTCMAGARYTKSIASLKLRHREHDNDPYSLHNNTIDFTQ